MLLCMMKMFHRIFKTKESGIWNYSTLTVLTRKQFLNFFEPQFLHLELGANYTCKVEAHGIASHPSSFTGWFTLTLTCRATSRAHGKNCPCGPRESHLKERRDVLLEGLGAPWPKNKKDPDGLLRSPAGRQDPIRWAPSCPNH